ncbi:MAG: Ku protein [Polyangiaceae bacterium]|nr:Ku protein [Polyangiaceae bacterium]
MRSFWSGEIAFGLVTIPAKLYTATRNLTPRFNLLHKECGTPIVTVRRCPKHQRDLAWEEIGKGYQVSKGEYVLFTPEELAKLDDDDGASSTVEIVEFVDPGEVDLAYLERSYWVGPGGKNLRGYDLLHRVLAQTNRVALAKVRLRTRTRMALLRPRGRLFALDMLRFAEELVPADEIEVPEAKAASPRETQLAMHLVGELSGASDPEKHPDAYRTAVLSAVDEKVEAGEVRRGERPAEEDEVEAARKGGGAQVVDLSTLLARSLKGSNDREPAPRAKRARATRTKGELVKAGRSTTAKKRRKTG